VPGHRPLAVAVVDELAELLGRRQQHPQSGQPDLEDGQRRLGADGGRHRIARQGADLAEDLSRFQDGPLTRRHVGRKGGQDDGPGRAAPASDHAFGGRPRAWAFAGRHVRAPADAGLLSLAWRRCQDYFDRALDDAVGGIAVVPLPQHHFARLEPDDVDVLADLLDDLVACLLGDAGEERKPAQLLRWGGHHHLEATAHRGLLRASRARAITSSCKRNSSLSGPRNSAGFAGADRAGARAPERSSRSSRATPRPLSSATCAAADRTPA